MLAVLAVIAALPGCDAPTPAGDAAEIVLWEPGVVRRFALSEPVDVPAGSGASVVTAIAVATLAAGHDIPATALYIASRCINLSPNDVARVYLLDASAALRYAASPEAADRPDYEDMDYSVRVGYMPGGPRGPAYMMRLRGGDGVYDDFEWIGRHSFEVAPGVACP